MTWSQRRVTGFLSDAVGSQFSAPFTLIRNRQVEPLPSCCIVPHLLLHSLSHLFPAMRCIVQRVKSASVTVSDELISSIDKGICVLVGIHRDDKESDAVWM